MGVGSSPLPVTTELPDVTGLSIVDSHAVDLYAAAQFRGAREFSPNFPLFIERRSLLWTPLSLFAL
jgi:hypothetical protein